MLGAMDERAPRSLPTLLDHRSGKGRRRDGRRRATIDASDGPDAVDFADVLRGVAARLDAILGDGAATTDLGSDRHEAIDAWSSAIVPSEGEGSQEARRRALATTVLKINASGSLDIVEEDEAETSEEADEATANAESAKAAEAAETLEGTAAEDVIGSNGAGTPLQTEERRPEAAAQVVVRDVDERLRSARERLERRRAVAARIEEPRFPPRWRRIDVDLRKLGQRLLVGLVIVGASAVVSLLVT